MSENAPPFDVGPEPLTTATYLRDIWQKVSRMEHVQNVHGARLDAIAGVVNGAEPNPASLAGVYQQTKQLRHEIDEHQRGHAGSGQRWWTAGLSLTAAVMGASLQALWRKVAP